MATEVSLFRGKSCKTLNNHLPSCNSKVSNEYQLSWHQIYPIPFVYVVAPMIPFQVIKSNVAVKLVVYSDINHTGEVAFSRRPLEVSLVTPETCMVLSYLFIYTLTWAAIFTATLIVCLYYPWHLVTAVIINQLDSSGQGFLGKELLSMPPHTNRKCKKKERNREEGWKKENIF